MNVQLRGFPRPVARNDLAVGDVFFSHEPRGLVVGLMVDWRPQTAVSVGAALILYDADPSLQHQRPQFVELQFLDDLFTVVEDLEVVIRPSTPEAGVLTKPQGVSIGSLIIDKHYGPCTIVTHGQRAIHVALRSAEVIPQLTPGAISFKAWAVDFIQEDVTLLSTQFAASPNPA